MLKAEVYHYGYISWICLHSILSDIYREIANFARAIVEEIFLFSTAGQTYVPGPGGEPVPLPTRHSFYHIYDFFEVIPGPVTEERAFEVKYNK